MQRLIALLMAVLLLAMICITPACADSKVDYSYIKSNPDAFDFEINDEGNAFVSMAVANPQFTHKNSPEGYSSLFYSDIIVIDYYKSPILRWRIWIDYCAKKSLGITSATFSYKGTDYSFDLTGDVSSTKYDNFVVEDFPIILGSENMLFWLALMLDLESCKSYEEIEKIKLTTTLHGAVDDITFDAPAESLFNIYLMGEAMMKMVGFEGMADTEGTKMETKENGKS